MLPRFQLAVILAASIFFGIGSILRAQDVGGGMVVTISGGGMASADYYLKIARELGVSKTLKKPFTFPELLEVIQELHPPPA